MSRHKRIQKELAQMTHRRLTTLPRTRTSMSTDSYHFDYGVQLVQRWLPFCIVQHTHLTRLSSFRKRNTGTLHGEIPKWTSKKSEVGTKVLSLMISCIQSYILSLHTILHSFLFKQYVQQNKKCCFSVYLQLNKKWRRPREGTNKMSHKKMLRLFFFF